MTQEIEGIKETKEKEQVMINMAEQPVFFPKEEMLKLALEKKAWVACHPKDREMGVDYFMMDFIISGLTGFSPAEIVKNIDKGVTSHLDLIKYFYSFMYPYLENVLIQYEFNRDNYALMRKEYTKYMKRIYNARMDEKIALEFIKTIGKMKVYEVFKTQFKKTHSLEEFAEETPAG